MRAEAWSTPRGATVDRISVVIPCFNHATYLGEAIEGVLTPRYSNTEVIVVDDGSTDETPEVAARYPVRYVRQVNSGLAAARNAGIRESSGEYLAFLDADDRLVPGALVIQRDHLRLHAEWAFVSGEHRYISTDGAVLEEWSGDAVGGDHYAAMLRKNYIGCCDAVMFRRAALDAVGGFDPGFRVCEDYDLYLRITQRFAVGAHNQLIADYRRYPESMSGDPARMLEGALRALDAQREFVSGDPGLESALEEGVAFWRRYYGGRLPATAHPDEAQTDAAAP